MFGEASRRESWRVSFHQTHDARCVIAVFAVLHVGIDYGSGRVYPTGAHPRAQETN